MSATPKITRCELSRLKPPALPGDTYFSPVSVALSEIFQLKIVLRQCQSPDFGSSRILVGDFGVIS
jgi:hypothetical protein